MNWDEQPDLYIIFRLAKAIHGIDDTWEWDGLGARWVKKGKPIKRLDWCLNWDSIGSLIEEHKISLIEFGGSWEAEIETSAPIGAFGTDEICSITEVNKNPLRAAVICLIKKLEAEK